jgi:prophage tail gpP-like protein
MQTETVTVVVGNQRYDSWISVNVRGSVKEAARSIKLVVAAEFGADQVAQAFKDQTPIAAYAGSDLIFTGYVDDLQPELGPDGPSTITISGRSKGADAIDCSADHTKPDYVGKTLHEIAKDQDVFGIGFTTDTKFDPIDRFRFNPGESLFRGLEILARDHGVTLAGQPDGGVKFTTAGAVPPRQPGFLAQGVNIQRGSSSHNSANRHSNVHVHGQSYKGVGKQNTAIDAEAKDKTVKRVRPVHVLHKGHATDKRVKKHAEHRRNREAGGGLTAIITTPGWRDETGALWTPGNKVWVSSPFLMISQDMLIEAADYLQDGEQEGTRVVLNLVDPRAHGGKAPKVNKSDSTWDMDDSDAEED